MSTFYERNSLNLCLEPEKAFCIADCPFNMDITNLLEKVRKKKWNTAYTDLRNHIAFPEIISYICDERFTERCPRTKHDEAIHLKKLEECIIRNASKRTPDIYRLSAKNQEIAVIGAGISGMSCALRLCEKKYNVTVYEKSNRIGGVVNDMMDSTLVQENILRHFGNEKVRILFNHEVDSLDKLVSGYNAIYISTGKNGSDIGTELPERGKYSTGTPGVFAGGQLTGADIIESCADGLLASQAIEEAYLKTGKQNFLKKKMKTALLPANLSGLKVQSTIFDEDGSFTPDQAVIEAGRCLKCRCDECRRNCDMLSYFGKPLLKVMEEIRATTEVKGVLGENLRVSTKMIALCDQCGRCTRACPMDIDIKKIFFDAKRNLFDRSDLPWGYYDWYIRCVKHMNSNNAVVLNPTDSRKPGRLFFPGCQLGGEKNGYVIRAYDKIRKIYPDTVLVVRCCGMPAYRSGDEASANEAAGGFEHIWEEMGRPEVIFACPGCQNMLIKKIRGLKTSYIYEYIEIPKQNQDMEVKVFDPCEAGEKGHLQNLIRKRIADAGIRVLKHEHEREKTRCCGFGIDMHAVNEAYEQYIFKRKAEELRGVGTVVTYCANCRNMLNRCGLNAVHYMDLVSGYRGGAEKVVDINDRERNWKSLKSYYSEHEAKINGMRIHVSAEIMKKLDYYRLLTGDIEEVISFCEKKDTKVIDAATGNIIVHRETGNITCWVEYRKCDGIYEILNAYSHRMRIVD